MKKYMFKLSLFGEHNGHSQNVDSLPASKESSVNKRYVAYCILRYTGPSLMQNKRECITVTNRLSVYHMLYSEFYHSSIIGTCVNRKSVILRTL
jgi:hypothetical protein